MQKIRNFNEWRKRILEERDERLRLKQEAEIEKLENERVMLEAKLEVEKAKNKLIDLKKQLK